jgi:hypothetical protein
MLEPEGVGEDRDPSGKWGGKRGTGGKRVWKKREWKKRDLLLFP